MKVAKIGIYSIIKPVLSVDIPPRMQFIRTYFRKAFQSFSHRGMSICHTAHSCLPEEDFHCHTEI